MANDELIERDDLALIRAFQDGEIDALSLLLKRRRAWLYNIAKRTVSDPQVAEDGLQEALVQIWKGAKDFRGDSQVTTWMYQIVTRCCIDVVRKENVRKAEAMPEDSENLIGSITGFEGKVVDTLFLHGALAELEPAHREILELIWLKESSLPSAGSLERANARNSFRKWEPKGNFIRQRIGGEKCQRFQTKNLRSSLRS